MAKKSWKQFFRSLPEHVRAKAMSLDSDDCIAACTVAIKVSDIQVGLFAHLGIGWEENEPTFPDKILPDPTTGRYSKWNRLGREIVHYELPKISKSWSIDAPNWGEWSYGTHEVVMSKEVYQRTFIPPKLLPILIESLGYDVAQHRYVFKFTVEEVLDRRAPNFLDDLLFNINLLQENTGNHGVFESNTTREEYLKTIFVNWEILPPGEQETMERILSDIKTDDPVIRAKIIDRYNFLVSLKPKGIIHGVSEFRRYIGAKFAEDLVVFENLEYGNAIYVMFEDWQELSKKSRTELLSSDDANYVRIVHSKTWKLRLQRVVAEALRERLPLD